MIFAANKHINLDTGGGYAIIGITLEIKSVLVNL